MGMLRIVVESRRNNSVLNLLTLIQQTPNVDEIVFYEVIK